MQHNKTVASGNITQSFLLQLSWIQPDTDFCFAISPQVFCPHCSYNWRVHCLFPHPLPHKKIKHVEIPKLQKPFPHPSKRFLPSPNVFLSTPPRLRWQQPSILGEGPRNYSLPLCLSWGCLIGPAVHTHTHPVQETYIVQNQPQCHLGLLFKKTKKNQQILQRKSTCKLLYS